MNLNSACLKTASKKCKAWRTETASNIWAYSITKPDDRVTTGQISRWEEKVADIHPRGKKKYNPSGGTDCNHKPQNIYFAWTEPGHQFNDQSIIFANVLILLCADNDFTHSFTSAWMTQQFTFLLSNSHHPPLLQILPETLPQCSSPQTPEQPTDSASKITKWSSLTK